MTLDAFLSLGLLRRAAAGPELHMHPAVRQLSSNISDHTPLVLSTLLKYATSRLNKWEYDYLESPTGRGAAIAEFEKHWPWIRAVALRCELSGISLTNFLRNGRGLIELLLPPQESEARSRAGVSQPVIGESIPARIYLVSALADQGKEAEALQLITRGLIPIPEDEEFFEIRLVTSLASSTFRCNPPASDADRLFSYFERLYNARVQMDPTNRRVVCCAAFHRALAADRSGDVQLARTSYDEALRTSHTLCDVRLETEIRLGLANTSIMRQDLQRARAEITDALDFASAWHDHTGEAEAKAGLARVLTLQGEFEEARVLADEYLQYLERIGHTQINDRKAAIDGWFPDTSPPASPPSSPAPSTPRPRPPKPPAKPRKAVRKAAKKASEKK